MTQEDYCSYEVAKLLKEKGFDEPTWTCYIEHKISHYDYTSSSNSELIDGVISAPTHQMTMKWLRDEKNILIYVYPVIDLPVKNDYTFHWRWNGKKKKHAAPHFGDKHNYESYEKAVEAALKYVLENLI